VKVCSITGCEKKVAARGWCGAHWLRWRKYADPLGSAPRAIRPETCIITNCDKPTHARDWCSMHYNRWRKYGDPLAVVQIQISKSGDCSIESCENSIYAHGLCRGHYGRRSRHGHPQADKPLWPKHPHREACSIEGCERAPVGRGWCQKHWTRWRNHGNPLALVINSKPSDWERFWSKVERGNPNDCWLWTGRLDISGYGQFGPSFGSPIKAHRYAYAEFVGPITPDRPVIDHRCRVRSCVNPGHLRAVTPAENAQNRATQIDSISGFRGVQFDVKKQMWFGRAKKGGRYYSTPRFKTVAEAHEAVSELRRQIFTHSEEDRQESPGTGVQVQVTQRGSNA
jgi:hypothetical protein